MGLLELFNKHEYICVCMQDKETYVASALCVT